MAYKKLKKDLGERQTLVYETLKVLKEANNLMVAKAAKMPINAVTPRMLELRDMGYVTESYRDKCPFTKRSTIYWRCRK